MPIIRVATSEDIDAIQNIFQAATNAHGQPEDWSRITDAGGVVVAETNERVVGFGGIDLDAVEQVKWLYVTPQFQGTGLGSTILERLEEIGRDFGFSVLRVHSAPSAENFYRKQGYETIEAHESVDHDHDGVELKKRLG